MPRLSYHYHYHYHYRSLLYALVVAATSLSVGSRKAAGNAYIGVSQVTDVMETQTLLYERTLEEAQAANNQTAVAELEAIGAPPFARAADHLIACRWLAEFQDQRFIEKRKLVSALVSSPHYTIADLKRFRSGMRFSLEHLWEPLGRVNLFKEITSFQIPVSFIQGVEDPLIPGELIERYSAGLAAPEGKRLVWIEDAGHMPHFEAPSDFYRVVVEVSHTLTK
jgi:proline iminopeptidase